MSSMMLWACEICFLRASIGGEANIGRLDVAQTRTFGRAKYYHPQVLTFLGIQTTYPPV